MRTLILADIHGNLAALEAVLASPEAAQCDRIVSLGDHTNFGPQSRAVHERLLSLHAALLLGNHEERLRRIGDAEFAGYNWTLLHATARQMAGADLDLPTDLRIATALCTHGTPGDPYHLLHPHTVPEALDLLPAGVTHLLSGHNHADWDLAHAGRRAVNPGSCGMWKDGRGSRAPFAVLTTEGDTVLSLTHHHAPYDTSAAARAYIETGCAAAAPQMCRACLHIMTTGDPSAVQRLMRFVADVAQQMHLTVADQAAWIAADSRFDWAEPIPSAEFWRIMEETLC